MRAEPKLTVTQYKLTVTQYKQRAIILLKRISNSSSGTLKTLNKFEEAVAILFLTMTHVDSEWCT